eukprot:5145902-Pleurochrysis_carterae.AAC.1
MAGSNEALRYVSYPTQAHTTRATPPARARDALARTHAYAPARTRARARAHAPSQECERVEAEGVARRISHGPVAH